MQLIFINQIHVAEENKAELKLCSSYTLKLGNFQLLKMCLFTFRTCCVMDLCGLITELAHNGAIVAVQRFSIVQSPYCNKPLAAPQ